MHLRLATRASGRRQTHSTGKYQENSTRSVDGILLMRIVRENWFSMDLGRLWGWDLGVGGERGATYGGATDNQTQLIHDRFNMTRARSESM